METEKSSATDNSHKSIWNPQENNDEQGTESADDIHPEATFGDVENCPSLPVVTKVTSFAVVPENASVERSEIQTENEEIIEEVLIANSHGMYREEHNVLAVSGVSLCDRNHCSERYTGEGISDDGTEHCESCRIPIPIAMLDDHLRTHEQLYEPLPCPRQSKCSKEFLTSFDLKNHLSVMHPDMEELIPTVYICGECKKEVGVLSALQIHANHRHPNTRVFGTKELLLTRTKKGEFVCPVCAKFYETRTSIVRHFNDVHQLGVESETTVLVSSESPGTDDDSPIDFEKSSPGRQSPERRESARLSARANRNHQSTMSQGNLAVSTSPVLALGQVHSTNQDDDPIICPSCNEVYHDMAAFKRHYYRHTVRYTCRVCNKKILGMTEYREHCSKHISRPRAPGEVKRTCPYCGKLFIDMKVHLKKHESSCEICGLQFVHLNNMNRHYLDVHNIDLSQFTKMSDGTKGRRMNTSLNFKLDGYHKTMQRMGHSDTEVNASGSPIIVKAEHLDFACEHCVLTYPSVELYNVHMITHNQKCKLCQTVVDQEKDILLHLRTVHGIKNIDNVSSLFEQTIFIKPTETVPMESAAPKRPITPVLDNSNQTPSVVKRQRLKHEDSVDLVSGYKKPDRDMQGRAECRICHRKVIDMNAHMATHNIKCSLCDYVSVQRFNLRPHMRQAHGLDDEEIDTLIEDIIADPVQVWDIPPENRVHNKPSQPKSSKTDIIASLSSISPIHIPRDNLKTTCKLCSKQFSDENMQRHMQTSHNVNCRRCGKFFVHQASIYSHMKKLHNINDHEQIRRDTICCQLNESDDEGMLSNASPGLKDSDPDYQVSTLVRKETKVFSNLQPRASILVSIPKPSTSGVKTKKCKVCKLVVDDIISHMNTHYKPCPLCDVQFHSRSFRVHIKEKHGITDPDAIRSLEADSSDDDNEDNISVLKEEHEERDQTPEPEDVTIPVLEVTQKLEAPTPVLLRQLSLVSVKCQFCNKMVRDLDHHLSTRHNLKCLICNAVIRHYGNAKTHMINMHGIGNPDVAKLTESMHQIELEHNLHGQLDVTNSVLCLSDGSLDSLDDGSRIRCEFCDASFKNRKYYVQHCKNVHKIRLPDKRKYHAAGGSKEDCENEGNRRALPDLLHVMEDLQYSK